MSEEVLVGDAPKSLSQVGRVVDTFVAPSATFKDILRSSSWWLPFVLMAVFSWTSTYIVGKQVGWDRVSENQVHLSPKSEERLSQATPEERASQMALSAKITRTIAYGFPVILLIIFLIYALILWGSFNLVLGAKTTFWQVFAVCWYASLPFLILSVLGIVSVLFGGNAEGYDIRNPVGTNLAYYMPDAPPILRALLTQLDLVRLWSLALTALGMAIVARKTIMQSAAVVLLWWFLGVGLAVVGASFS
jgi:hypothetical protein